MTIFERYKNVTTLLAEFYPKIMYQVIYQAKFFAKILWHGTIYTIISFIVQ